MAQNRDEIIRRYRMVAHIPEFLFGFTFPVRRRAIKRLEIEAGQRILEVGCGTAVNFTYLVEAVGSSGEIVGVDISPDMVAQAKARVKKEQWANVQIIESSAEEMSLSGLFDGILMFAMHDVLTSPQALDRTLSYLRPGGRIVVVGPKLVSTGMGKLLNPLVSMAYSRFSVAQQDKDRPWRLLEERIKLHLEEHALGMLFIVWGDAQT
jgi:ubiquinone/menaquinone biosynthesis C-methylase UbiE